MGVFVRLSVVVVVVWLLCGWGGCCARWFVSTFPVEAASGWFGHCSLTHFSKQINVVPPYPVWLSYNWSALVMQNLSQTCFSFSKRLLWRDAGTRKKKKNMSTRVRKPKVLFQRHTWCSCVSSPFTLQTKAKLQMSTASDIEKYLSTAQIQNWMNSDLQRYKVSNERCQQQQQQQRLERPGCLLCKWSCSDF